MGRIFDRKLSCGCYLSADGGGGLIPCHYGNDPKQEKKCDKAWAKWRKTKDYKKYEKECVENNQ